MSIDSHHWVVLAKDSNPNARGRLLIDLSRVVLEPGLDDGSVHAIFFDIVRRVLSGLSTEDRRSFADLVADRSPFPHDVLMSLASDDIEVAEPVLQRAIGLLEDDLADLAARFGTGHRAAIATRTVVSPRIVRILLGCGDREVMLRLGANRGAVLGADGLSKLEQYAESDEDLRRVLLSREGTARLSRRVKDDKAAVVAPPAPAASSAPERPLVDALVERVRVGAQTLDATVIELADADRHADLACFFGRLAHIDESSVMRVLVRADVAGIATLAGGLALGESAFDRLVDLRRRKLKFSAAQVRWERDAYRKLDRSEARLTLDALGQRRRVA